MLLKVQRKAAFDFDCDQKDLRVQKIDSGTYGAIGCGKRATYVAKDSRICTPQNHEANIENHCEVVADMASASTPPQSSQP